MGLAKEDIDMTTQEIDWNTALSPAPSEKFGPQNGLFSLVKAADGGENIENHAFIYTKVTSEKSPAGYAHRWQPVPTDA